MMPEVSLRSQSAFRTQRVSFARKTRGGIYLPQYCWIMKNRHRDPLFLHTWQLPSPTFFYKRYQEVLLCCSGWVSGAGGEGKGSINPSQSSRVLSGCMTGPLHPPFTLLQPHLDLKQIHTPSFGYPNDPCLGQRFPPLWLSVPVFLTGEGQLMCKAAEWRSGWTIKAVRTLQK